MSIYKKGPALLASVILCLCLCQMAWAQNRLTEDVSTREFSTVEDFDLLMPAFLPPEGGDIYEVDGQEVTREECDKAKQDGRGCAVISRSFGSVAIPKYAAPFQVQLVTSPAFKSDAAFQNLYPNIPLWDLRHVCGGSLIAENWVLTAAHCFKGFDPEAEGFAEKFNVRLDVGNLAQTSSKNVAIKDIIKHPLYKDGIIGNDIALLQLEESDTNLTLMNFRQEDDGRDPVKRDIRKAMILGGGKNLVTLGQDNIVKLWDIENRQERTHQNLGNGAKVFNIKTQKLFVSKDKTLRVIDLKTLQQDPDINHGAALSGWQISTDGQRALTWGSGRVKLWNLNSGTLIAEVPARHVHQAKYINDNRILVMGSNFSVSIWDSVLRERIMYLPNDQHIEPVIWPKSDEVLIAEPKRVRLINANSRIQLKIFPMPDGLESFEVTENDKWFIAKSGNGRLSIWDFKSGRKKKDPHGHDGAELLSAAEGQSGDRILLKLEAGRMGVWDMATERILPIIMSNRTFQSMPPILFSNGNRVLSSEHAGVTRVWNANTGELVYKIDHSVPITHIELSEDGRDILSYGDYGIAEVWDAKTGDAKTRVFHGGSVLGSRLYNDGKSLLTWGSAGKARLWDVPQTRHIGHNRTPKVDQEIARFIHPADSRPPSSRTVNSEIKPSLVSLINRSRNSHEPATKDHVLTFGWGKTRPVKGYEPSAVLRMIALSIEDKSLCLSMIDKQGPRRAQVIAAFDNKTLFCARAPYRKTCEGDSGGPVVVDDKIVGIVSLGGYNCGEDGQPGFYTRVGAYANWVSDEINKVRAD